jgi:hypothetical protein
LKYEKESRVSAQEVPADALRFVEKLAFPKRIKWYYEESLQGHSFEAKAKKNGQLYSVEFDTLGQLEDIEIDVPWQSLPDSTKSSIVAFLDASYQTYLIEHVQLQYTGSTADLLGLLVQNRPTAHTKRYEMIVKAVVEKNITRYELLFSANGTLLSQKTIVSHNTDYLEY